MRHLHPREASIGSDSLRPLQRSASSSSSSLLQRVAFAPTLWYRLGRSSLMTSCTRMAIMSRLTGIDRNDVFTEVS